MKLGTKVHYEQCGDGVVVGHTYVKNTIDIRTETGDVLYNVSLDHIELTVKEDGQETED